MKKAFFAFLTLAALLILISSPAFAQNYSFTLSREVVNAYYTKDGTLSLDYVFDFTNNPGASPIDYVDVGLPNGNFDLSSVKADVNGNPVTDISEADPKNLAGGGYGVTLALGSLAIPAGQTGKVHLYVGTIRDVLYPYKDNSKKDYTSTQFSPTWFGSDFVHGNTDLTVSIHLPPGIRPEEPIYYTPSNNWPGPKDPLTGLDDQDRVLYTWNTNQANGSTQYTFGAAFPAVYIPAAAIVKEPAFTVPTSSLFCLCMGGLFFLLLGWGIYSSIWGAKKRKLQYMTPKISIEGHGIKRGLTAVEAAILMEQPVDKVMTMVLFGAVKKGAATVVSRDPLEIQVASPLPESLEPYERDFLTAFKQQAGLARRKALQDTLVNLVKSVSEKMKGFSRKETIAYYQDIMRRAWEQVEAAGTPEVKSQKYEEVMDWTMLDHDYGRRTRDVFGQGPIFVPTWWPMYDPVYRSHMGGVSHPISTTPVSTPSTSSSSGGRGVSLPTLPGSDFAASVVNGVQSLAAGAVGDLTAFTSGVTNRTNPVPPPTSSSWKGGGDGGAGHCACACACACAGCACACAGGGR